MSITISPGMALGLLGTSLLLAACSGEHPAPAAPQQAQPSSPPTVSAFTGKNWELRRMTAKGAEVPLPAGVKASITFEKTNGVTGYSGVNTFSGSYASKGASLQWTTPFASTRRGGPPEAMEFERVFLSVLRACDTLEAGVGLTLSGTEGTLAFSSGSPGQ